MASAIQANVVQMSFTNCFEIVISFCHIMYTVLELASINNCFKLTCSSEIIMTLDWVIRYKEGQYLFSVSKMVFMKGPPTVSNVYLTMTCKV